MNTNYYFSKIYYKLLFVKIYLRRLRNKTFCVSFLWKKKCIFRVVYIAQSQSPRLQRIDPEERQIHDAKVGAAGFRGVLKLASYNTLSQDRKMRSRV